MQSQGVTTLDQAVRNVPGVTIGSAEGGTIGNNINLNGFNARTDIYLDAMRDRGQYYRDVFALEAVEVLMGPSSMLFGRGSTGGVINQVTKNPGLKQRHRAQPAGHPPTASCAPPRTSNVPFEGDQRGAGQRPCSSGARPRPSTIPASWTSAWRPSVTLGLGKPTTITLGAILQHRKDQPPNYGVPPLNGFPLNAPRNTTYGFNNDNTEQDSVALLSTLDHKFNSGLSLRNQTSFSG